MLSSYEIKKNNEVDRIIQDIVREILDDIQCSINECREKLENVVVVDIPTVFEIPTMRSEDAQRTIYYYILRALDYYKYDAKIKQLGSKRGTQKVQIHIMLESDEDIRMKKHMDDYIRQKSIK